MTSKNDITGDVIATKQASDAYRDGWDRIFGKKKPKPKKEKKSEDRDRRPDPQHEPQE